MIFNVCVIIFILGAFSDPESCLVNPGSDHVELLTLSILCVTRGDPRSTTQVHWGKRTLGRLWSEGCRFEAGQFTNFLLIKGQYQQFKKCTKGSLLFILIVRKQFKNI